MDAFCDIKLFCFWSVSRDLHLISARETLKRKILHRIQWDRSYEYTRCDRSSQNLYPFCGMCDY